MKWALLLLLLAVPAGAQTNNRSTALAVSSCGTTPSGYAGGLTQDQSGNLCNESTCGVSPPVTYNVGQSYRILIDTNGKLCTD